MPELRLQDSEEDKAAGDKKDQGKIAMQCIHSMKTELFFDSGEQSRIALEAIKPDLREHFPRSSSAVARKGSALEVRIEASDLTAMRASFNSVMKGIVVSGKILKAFEKKN